MEQINKLDLFGVVKNGGLKKAFFFYSFGFFGTLFMTISFLMILSNALNEQNSIIMIIILVKIMKSLSELSSTNLGTFQDQMYVKTKNTIHQLQLIKTNEKFNQFSYEIQAFSVEMPQPEHQILHSKFLELQWPHLINSISNKETFCGSNCISVPYRKLIIGECLEDCYLQLSSVCLVFDKNEILSGCYENQQLAQYSKERTNQIQIYLRHVKDPLVQVNHKCTNKFSKQKLPCQIIMILQI
ncbi:unnamed protein product (macronuclear) [Paramecium tetraurelia]|uniref:Transmembrane protein n=1 Tax=Paramecium tetraurelia TaxID=5888 RepID=A0E2T0_PARTE|nr:uncharacterized protein GSPATT00022769001 [Paramecium tetraurelia]CAK89597.1 unnamed protein product [Paramecium tetraurelia]|eukprot:XP_001456994.1 hypothetical protein (macronuclear) [Paramecium tetraurelia strain d4-2]